MPGQTGPSKPSAPWRRAGSKHVHTGGPERQLRALHPAPESQVVQGRRGKSEACVTPAAILTGAWKIFLNDLSLPTIWHLSWEKWKRISYKVSKAPEQVLLVSQKRPHPPKESLSLNWKDPSTSVPLQSTGPLTRRTWGRAKEGRTHTESSILSSFHILGGGRK